MRSLLILSAYCLFIVSSCSGPKLVNVSGRNNFVVDTSETKNELDAMITPYRDSMQSYMGEVIGRTDSTIEKFAPESPLGNLIADMVFDAGMKYAGEKDWSVHSGNTFCLLNFGGLRSEINRGEITVGEVFELMPFDNAMTIVRISTDSIAVFFRYLEGCQGQPISNAEIILGVDADVLKIGGKHFNESAFVNIITSDYLADGGDEMQFLATPMKRWDSGILIRDVIMDYIRKTENLEPPGISGRMIILEE